MIIINVLLLLIPNIFFLKEKYNIIIADHLIIIGVFLSLIASFAICSLIIYYVNLTCFIILNCIIYLLNSVVSYFQFFYKIIISPTLIQAIFRTDVKETIELINLSLIMWVIFIGILPCYLLVLANNKITNIKFSFLKLIKSIVIISTILISTNVVLIGKDAIYLRIVSNSLLSFMPYNYLFGIINYYKIYYRDNNIVQDINKVAISTIENDTNNINIVLIIGESSRSDRWAINGYHRPTNPNLANIENIITFSNIYSLATDTSGGVNAIMKNSIYDNYSSFISIFNILNFDTYWLSNQGIKYKTINSIAKEAKVMLFSDDIRATKVGNNYDIDLLPFITQSSNHEHNKLIVIHTMGSHRLYDLRYPLEFKKFQPVCVNGETYYSVHECRDLTKLNNSYDNTILYTDFFISEVIKIFKNKKTLLIYISDHGESLGEEGAFAHAYPLAEAPIEQLHIPLIFWASDQWLSDDILHQKFNQLLDKKNNFFDQSNIFHTILDCVNIKSKLINKEKSMCQ